MYSIFQKHKLPRGTRLSNYLVDNLSNAHQSRKRNGKRSCCLPAIRNDSAKIKPSRRPQSPPLSALSAESGRKGESPLPVPRTPTSAQSAPTCSTKDVSKTKEHLSQLKMLLSQKEFRKNPKWISGTSGLLGKEWILRNVLCSF